MSKIRLRMAMSLDGYIAGPNQSVENPLGIGGLRLHEWVFKLEAFRKMHGQEGGITNESSIVVEEMFENVGASIMGRNMFGGGPGPWPIEKPWNGWWGENPPYHHPVFVLTHHARDPLYLEGGNSFTFVTDGIDKALTLAQKAANGKDISIGGGAQTIRSFLKKNLIDEMNIDLAPFFLGNGERPFQDLGTELKQFKVARTISTPDVVHLKLIKI